MGARLNAIVDEAGDCGLLGIKALYEEAPGLQLNAEGLAEHAVIVRHQHLCPLRLREGEKATRAWRYWCTYPGRGKVEKRLQLGGAGNGRQQARLTRHVSPER
jgi:hypothetical protein